jgi:hypothetical protein
MIRLPAGYKNLIDEFGCLEGKIAQASAYVKRREELRKQFLEWAEHVPPKQGVDIEGVGFCVAISPRRPERVITSMAKVLKAMGEKCFLEECNISVKSIEENVPAAAFAKLVEERPIGRRTVTATRRAIKGALKRAA